MNLLGFGLLIALIIAIFVWQMMTLNRDLGNNTLNRSRMIAAIIEENLAYGDLAGSTMDALISAFLRDKARFIAYLNGIDPLQSEELAALARETGLLGLTVVDGSGRATSGPEPWLEQPPDCRNTPDQLLYDDDRQTVRYTFPATSADVRCILVGMDARAIIALRQKTALPVLLANLSRLPGIDAVRMEANGDAATDSMRLIATGQGMTAEARIPISKGALVVSLDATQHVNRMAQMRRQFFLFTALLLGLGLFFSWLLYRHQQRDLERTRNFERLLAKEHEAAALGRATATIAHEVRNPLNAINMGLQRLALESPELDTEQRQLIQAMKEAVRRAGLIITELQRFTRPLAPRIQAIDPFEVVDRMLALYRQPMAEQGIKLELSGAAGTVIETDGDLLAEILENLLRNALEAQPAGGFIRIETQPATDHWHLTMTNGGYRLSAEESARLGEPYFTTKTRGTGLGLALCRKIATAHGGELRLTPDLDRQRLSVHLILPVASRSTPNPQSIPSQ
jgi:signal transduction histidine kinase